MDDITITIIISIVAFIVGGAVMWLINHKFSLSSSLITRLGIAGYDLIDAVKDGKIDSAEKEKLLCDFLEILQEIKKTKETD